MSGSGFEVRSGTESGLRLLSVAGHGVTCSIAHRGATVLGWRHGDDEILDGYRNPEELQGQDGVRNAVMAPFAGRVRDAAYTWHGEAHDLRPGDADREIFHGFLREQFFEALAVRHLERSVIVHLRALTGPSTRPGYPFPLQVDVHFEVRPDGLSLTLSATNVGTSTAPVSLGWHPYLRLPSAPTIDGVRLRLPGRDAEAIGGTQFDTCFDTSPFQDGRPPERIESVLSGPRGEELTVWQDAGAVYVYTGDRLARDRRASIAIQPISHPPFSFNDAAAAESLALRPGAARSFHCGFDYRPADRR